MIITYRCKIIMHLIFSLKGNTEREFLANIESIVRNSLPHEKLKVYFADIESAKMAILNKVTFCSERVKVCSRCI